MMKLKLFVGAYLVMCISAFGSVASGSIPAGTLFICDRGEPTVQVVLPFDHKKNPVLLLGSEQLEMAPVPVGSGFGADLILGPNHWMIRGKGQTSLLLMKNNDAAKKCQVVKGQKKADETNADGKAVSTMGNFTLGGNVRAAASKNAKIIDKLNHGEPVISLKRTGVMLKGYEWFQIEYGEGQTGFHWGGLMCSKALHITGITAACPAGIK